MPIRGFNIQLMVDFPDPYNVDFTIGYRPKIAAAFTIQMPFQRASGIAIVFD